MCIPSRLCAGVHRNTLSEMETSDRSDRMGHSAHHGLHFHLQWPHHCTMGPGKFTFQKGSNKVDFSLHCYFFASDIIQC